MAEQNILVRFVSPTEVRKVICILNGNDLEMVASSDRTEWTCSRFIEIEGAIEYFMGVVATAETKWNATIKLVDADKVLVDKSRIVPPGTMVDGVSGKVAVAGGNP